MGKRMTEKKAHIRDMFGQIAPRYDLLNRLMTFGQDIRWRKILVRKLSLPSRPKILDIGCGTGDLALEIRRQNPSAMVIAADFTPEMVLLGASQHPDPGIQWVIADAAHLPFQREGFDGLVSGYLLRNVPDIDRALQEQARVCRPGAWAASLDTTPPDHNWFRPLITFYLNSVIPLLGRLVGGSAFAYQYLSDSTQEFLEADQLSERFRQAGFQDLAYRKLMLGTMAIHWGQKSPLS